MDRPNRNRAVATPRELLTQLGHAALRGDEEAVHRLHVELNKARPSGLQNAGRLAPFTPAQIVASWIGDGPLLRIPTGIAPLDALCKGGLRIPWRVMLVGAPSAGKTFVLAVLANSLARALSDGGACVGVLAIDEEPEDVTVRLAQLAGFELTEVEARDECVLREVVDALQSLRIRLYDGSHTIESAAADLNVWAASENKHAALFLDSIQKVRSELSVDAKGPREEVDANAVAIRAVSTRYRMLVVSTSEANRSSYRSATATVDTNDLAAGAESREIEYAAQTLLVLRTPPEDPDIVHVRVAKNRRAWKGQFWLRMDPENHTLRECEEPARRNRAGHNHDAPSHLEGPARTDIRNAKRLAKLLHEHPAGLSGRELRKAAQKAGIKLGAESLKCALDVLREGLEGFRVIQETAGRSKLTRLVPNDHPRDDPVDPPE